MNKVSLIQIMGINTAKKAMATCTDSNWEKMNIANCVGTTYNSYHKSIFEHIIIQYEVVASISCISQLNRHKHIAISQLSTRYALQKMLKNDENTIKNESLRQIYTDIIEILKSAKSEHSNDELKLLCPAGMQSRVIYTQTLPDYINIIVRRLDKKAHIEAQDIAREMLILILQVSELNDVVFKILKTVYHINIDILKSDMLYKSDFLLGETTL